jgi:hypothetical protein
MKLPRSHDPDQGFGGLTWVIFYVFLVSSFNIKLVENLTLKFILICFVLDYHNLITQVMNLTC